MIDLSNIRNLNDNELLTTTISLVAQERQLTADILNYLAEIESRRLYAQRGFASLWEFATKELRYSSGAAYRRIDAMRLMKTLNPEDRNDTLVALNEGRLNLSAVNAVTQFLKDEKKENGKSYGAAHKKKILDQVQGKSKPECQRILASINPANSEKAKRHIDQTRALSADRTEVCFAMGPELADNLEQIKNLWAHHFKTSPTYEELLLKMSELVLERINPVKQPARKSAKDSAPVKNKSERVAAATDRNITASACTIATTTNSATSTRAAVVPLDTEVKHSSAAKVHSTKSIEQLEGLNKMTLHKNKNTCADFSASRPGRPYISVNLKRAIWRRDQGRCTYVDKNTGRRCTSQFRLQIEHENPFCLGGADTAENLSLKCQAHNALLAFEKLGSTYMARFMPGGTY